MHAIKRLLAFSVLLLSSSVVVAATFEEGVQYERVNPAQPTVTGDKIEVRELFWYGCPHCYQFEPYVQRWLKQKPANVEFVRTPAVFNPSWAIAAQAYYTAEALGVVDKIHEDFFVATHEKKLQLNTKPRIMAFFIEHGVTKEEFEGTFDSFAVKAKVQKSIELTRAYGIDGVPSVIVQGKYRTGAGMSGSHANTINVINYLTTLK